MGSKDKADKQDLPYLIIDLVLGNSELYRMPKKEGQSQEFKLTPHHTPFLVQQIRELIKQVYDKKGDNNGQ